MKIALVQMDVQLGAIDRNLSEMLKTLRRTREQGATLTIFPECALTGYCFDDLNEAARYADSIPGSATSQFQKVLQEVGGYAVFGMLEARPGGVFNAAVLMGPDGVVSAYRKVHLPCLGVDAFASHGDRPFTVATIEDLRVGLGICYDSAFPEAIRTMALQGADLIALPTNFPTGAEAMVEHVQRTRAMENNIYFAGCNRVGDERGFHFIGRSQVVDPSGKWIAISDSDQPEILYAEIDPARARKKRVVRVPGKHAIDRFADRRPEFYSQLTKAHDLPSPGRNGEPIG